MRLPEKRFDRHMGDWRLGVTLCPGIWRVSIWWDGDPYDLTITLPFLHIWVEHG